MFYTDCLFREQINKFNTRAVNWHNRYTYLYLFVVLEIFNQLILSKLVLEQKIKTYERLIDSTYSILTIPKQVEVAVLKCGFIERNSQITAVCRY